MAASVALYENGVYTLTDGVSLPARWENPDGSDWIFCKMRKPHQCTVCGEKIARGEFAYRPIKLTTNHADRVCTGCAQ